MSKFRRLFVIAGVVVAPAICAAATRPDIENGKATFNTMCSVCHAVQKTGDPIEGPNLLGVEGRKAASQPEFTKYSQALKASKLTWSTKTLNKFLVNPGRGCQASSCRCRYPDDQTRADVVAYLATLKD